jgi:hypothetical protein
MEPPYLRIEESGTVLPLSRDVTTIGRGSHVDVRLADPSVSRLHAEIVRRGPYAYVIDLGLSRNGTRVNGRLVAQRLLDNGDVITFGSARCRVGGLPAEDCPAEVDLRKATAPELTRRELDVVTSLCRPALSDEAFVTPATAREVAAELVVTEAAVKQHLLRLYQKLRIPEGPNRRVRLANDVVARGLVRPLPRAGEVPAALDGDAQERPGHPAAPGQPAPPVTGAARADPGASRLAGQPAEACSPDAAGRMASVPGPRPAR